MEIRPATPADLPSILPMVQKICDLHRQWDPKRYDARPEVTEMYSRWLSSRVTDEKSVVLYANDNDRAAGFIIGLLDKEIPIYTLAEYGFIADLWVEEDYRNEGIGRQMVMLAIEKFRQLGVKQVRLETARANDPARQLFSSVGFRQSMIEMTLDFT